MVRILTTHIYRFTLAITKQLFLGQKTIATKFIEFGLIDKTGIYSAFIWNHVTTYQETTTFIQIKNFSI